MKDKPIKIVILGAGFAGIYAYFNLHKHFHGKNVKIVLISEHDYFLFVTLLHEVATGSLLPLNITQSIRSLSLCCLESFIEGHVDAVDFDRKKISVCRKPFDVPAQENVEKSDEMLADISYDYLISALGSAPNFFNTPGAAEHAFTLKTQDDAKYIKNRFIDNFAKASEISDPKVRKAMLHTAVIGGGPTGVEVAGELADYVNHEMYSIYPALKGLAKITIYQSGDKLLPQVDDWFHTKAEDILCKKMNVEVSFKARVTEITEKSIKIGEKEIPSGLTIWTAGVKAQDLKIISEEKIEKEERTERVKVNQHLQLEQYPEVFVIGDQAWVYDKDAGVPYPMRAQFAQREGVIAADNINAHIHKRPLRVFEWKDQGFIVSLGKGGALAEVFKFKLSGPFAWWIYRTVYASKIVGWRAKIRTVLEWTLNLFFPRDVSKL